MVLEDYWKVKLVVFNLASNPRGLLKGEKALECTIVSPFSHDYFQVARPMELYYEFEVKEN